MKLTSRILFAALFIVFFGFSANSQKTAGKYTDYDRGYYYYYYQKWDSAFQMFTRYVNNPDDSLKKGKAYNYMAEMQWNTGDLYGAQQSLIGSIGTLDSLDKNHRKDIGQAYNLLGNVSLDLKKYDEAIRFYQQAVFFFNGSDSVLEAMNGKATALQKKGNYEDAVSVYDSILALNPSDPLLIARAIDNRARTIWLKDPDFLALPEYRFALRIRADSQYGPGLNASYAHLSDYYAKSDPDSALWYAQKMLEIAKEIQSPGDILEAMDKLIRLNNSASLKERWYEEYKILSDSLQFSRDTTRNRFALILNDFQKSKADNLLLQQHITRQRLLMYGLIVLAVVVISGLSIWYGKRRKRIKQESENAIRDALLKTSQKVHDVVANGLYGIMNELEHTETLEKEPLMTRIEGLYEKSRDISYEDSSPGNNADYDRQIHHLLNSFANDQLKVIVVGNQPAFWSRITAPQKHELQLILNEIMINMKKHSHAKNVVIAFKQENNKGFISYKDDGVGFPADFEFGNGLKNTVSRIKSINGEAIFGKSEKEGVSIVISFPFESVKT